MGERVYQYKLATLISRLNWMIAILEAFSDELDAYKHIDFYRNKASFFIALQTGVGMKSFDNRSLHVIVDREYSWLMQLWRHDAMAIARQLPLGSTLFNLELPLPPPTSS